MNGKQWHIHCGPLALVFICLVGTSGYSGKLYLQSSHSVLAGSNVQRDKMDSMVIKSSGDLVEISVVILGIDDSNFHYTWYVNEIGIYNCQSGNQDGFPSYHWIREMERM